MDAVTPGRRIAITGHRSLSPQTAALVDRAIRNTLAASAPDVTGVSCLADGADQIFARAVTDLGGSLEVIVPASDYPDALPAGAQPEYDTLIARAAEVHRMPFAESTPETHMAASEFMIDMADELYAVWDGEPGRAFGGTADAVSYARDRGIPVQVIWPDGATRAAGDP